MGDVINLSSKKSRISLVNVIDSDILSVLTLMNDNEFFSLINSDDIDWDITDPIITRFNGVDGWAIGLHSEDIIINCYSSGKIRTFESLEYALSVFLEHGLGSPRIYSSPLISSVAEFSK